MAKAHVVRHEGSVGALLSYWRSVRRMTQLALAQAAEVSVRHVNFIETGRANPSREMVMLLARVLDVPLRERNTLLMAAGFAPLYLETNLSAPELAPVRAALDAILRQQEPYPAVVMNRYWDILRVNDAAVRFFRFMLGERASTLPSNVLRRMFDPGAVRPLVANWDAYAQALIQRVHRECVGGVPDARTQELLRELLAYPGVPRSWRHAEPATPLLPLVPVTFAREHHRFDFFSTVTTLGTPQDITLQEIRIECFYPVDAATEEASRRLVI
jgi:transcriptional regulator with XRE-family HTH domain